MSCHYNIHICIYAACCDVVIQVYKFVVCFLINLKLIAKNTCVYVILYTCYYAILYYIFILMYMYDNCMYILRIYIDFIAIYLLVYVYLRML